MNFLASKTKPIQRLKTVFLYTCSGVGGRKQSSISVSYNLISKLGYQSPGTVIG